MMIQRFLGTRGRSSARGARQQLATDPANFGSELHEGKAEAYGMTPEDRAQIPEAPSATWTDPVTGVHQVGFDIVDCGIPFGDSTFILASLDESAISICDDMHRLVGGISNSAAMLLFRWPTYHACIVRTFFAGSTPPKLTKYFCTKIDDKIRCTFASVRRRELSTCPAKSLK
jgi:hypothetical protein